MINTTGASSGARSDYHSKTRIFSKPISDICESHGMDYHCYADDTQIYIVVEPRDNLSDM
jgi:hypothetical protein